MSNSWELIKKRLDKQLEPHGAIGEFCKESGIKRRTLTAWLKEGQVPSIDFIDKIAKGLGIDASELIKPETQAPSLVPPIKQQLVDLVLSLNEREASFIAPNLRALVETTKTFLQGSENGKKSGQG